MVKDTDYNDKSPALTDRDGKLITVLLVDNDPAARRLVEQTLRRPTEQVRFSLEIADCLSTALKCLERKKFDNILLDLQLPDSRAVQSVEQIHRAAPDSSIIVLTALRDQQLGAEAIKKGAQYYFVKSRFDQDMLIRYIQLAIERKSLEKRLSKSQKQLALILKYSGDGINLAWMDPKTFQRRLLLCNDRYVEMSGRTRQELFKAKDLNEFVQPQCSLEEVRQNREKLLRGQVCRGLSSWIRPDGKKNYYEWTAAPVRVGQKLCIVGVDRNITQQLLAEISLKAINRILEESGKALEGSHENADKLVAQLQKNMAEILQSNHHLQLHESLRQTQQIEQGICDLVTEISRAPQSNDAASAEHGPAISNYRSKDKYTGTVLLVEDHLSNQMVMALLLKKLGLHVTAVDNGRRALEKITSDHFDLILLDMGMPIMNGYETARVIRENGITTPIVAITGYTGKSTCKECIDAGCDNYLTKPVRREDIAQIVRRYLSPVAT
ncbi:MAG: response regulator [Planctomycetota bacterium]